VVPNEDSAMTSNPDPCGRSIHRWYRVADHPYWSSRMARLDVNNDSVGRILRFLSLASTRSETVRVGCSASGRQNNIQKLADETWSS